MIGSRVLSKLIDLGHNVAGIDNFSVGWQGKLNKKARIFNVDIRSINRIKQGYHSYTFANRSIEMNFKDVCTIYVLDIINNFQSETKHINKKHEQ